MLTLTCPYCGVEACETDLSPGGEAHLTRFGPDSADDDFEQYLFLRENPRGVHFERWRHAHGCGKWFHAARCTVTMEVFGTYAAQTSRPPQALLDTITARRPGWRWRDLSAAE
jgi:sarcosine oxidase subunit delta